MNINGVVKLKEMAELRRSERITTDLQPFDSLTGGLVRGGTNEIFGDHGSGKRSIVISILSNLTKKNFICVIVDTTNSFDPVSAEKNGINLNKILWIQCDNQPQKAVIATDYLIQSSLFGAIWLDMGFCREDFLQRMPNAYWFRFKVGLKDKPTALIVTLKDTKLKSAAHQSIKVTKERQIWSGNSNFRIATKSFVKMELIRPRSGKGEISIISDYL